MTRTAAETAAFHRGYQEALRDVAQSFAQGGPVAAAEWVAANVADDTARTRATTAATGARRDAARLDAAAAYLDACDFDPDTWTPDADEDARRWQIEVDADLDTTPPEPFVCEYRAIRPA